VGKGTGLGLATVFGIVKQNHGLINVYSEPGRGTTFKIYLPRTEAKTVAAAEEVQQRPLRGSETVLLVEDEEQILNLGRRILQRLGYTVLAAPTPAAALALAEQQAGLIHLLVTDLVMPGMNGKELAERLQANHPDLKCLFMSGYTADVIAHHGVLQAGVAFLQKPFTVQTLAVKVREVLEAHREPPRQP
jgi:CheY-like chemotaxis protein